MSKIVVALGGNALGNNHKEQLNIVKETVKSLVDLISEGHELIITHGNGPQVGMIFNAMANVDPTTTEDDLPFPESGAMSQGYIGYHLQQAMEQEFKKRKMRRNIVTVVSQVEVEKNDKAFEDPTKPIGPFYKEKEAKKLMKETGDIYKEDAGRGWRKVIASPKPKKIVELQTIKKLIKNHTTIITCGGGGIPVINTNNGYVGVDAVIDKDRTSALLAKELDADILLILTAVEQVSINFNKSNEKKLNNLSIEEAKEYIKKEEFAKGSMLPKVEACIDFLTNSRKKKAIITSLDKASAAIKGNAGTTLVREDNKIAVKKDNNKKTKTKRKKRYTLTAFSILLIMTVLIGLASNLISDCIFVNGQAVTKNGVIGATLSQTLISPILGFKDAMDICIFILALGAFLKVITKTNALETGIRALIKKLKGKELLLIPILMLIFSIGGTTYGMQEETVGFYVLLSFAMVAAGMDTLVAAAIVLLGAGSGVLGSTINPFAVGAAIDALPDTIQVNQAIMMAIGALLWVITYLISTGAVMLYAKKVLKKKGSTILSLQERKEMVETYALKEEKKKEDTLSSKQKITLSLFLFTFIIMIIGFIPWTNFGVNIFESGYIFPVIIGTPLGDWYFQEATLWFLIMAIIIALINKMNEHEIVDTLIDGANDMIGVIAIIAIARGASILMTQTNLDDYIINHAAIALSNVSQTLFVPLNYLIHVGLSILVPSSSGLASLSTPIMAPLAETLNFSVETTLMEMISANGLVNLFAPTCGVIMAGLELAKVEYSTWLKWVAKVIVLIAIANILVLTFAMYIL